MYDLYGVVNHINYGGYGGHYTANILPSSSILEDNQMSLINSSTGNNATWFNCNDSNIK